MFTQQSIQAQIKENIKALAFVREIHRKPVNSPHKRPVTRKMFPFDDVMMVTPGIKKYIPTNGNLIFMAYLIAPLVTLQFPLIQFMTSESKSSRMSNYGIHQTYFMNYTSLFLNYFRTRYIYFASYCQWRLILPVWQKKPYEGIACVALGGKKACQWDSVTWVV